MPAAHLSFGLCVALFKTIPGGQRALMNRPVSTCPAGSGAVGAGGNAARCHAATEETEPGEPGSLRHGQCGYSHLGFVVASSEVLHTDTSLGTTSGGFCEPIMPLAGVCTDHMHLWLCKGTRIVCSVIPMQEKSLKS